MSALNIIKFTNSTSSGVFHYLSLHVFIFDPRRLGIEIQPMFERKVESPILSLDEDTKVP